MKDGLYTFEELSFYMDKAKEPLSELVKASQEREKLWHDELIKSQSKVEEMKKALEWYADENNYEMVETHINEYSSETTSEAWIDSGERARQALKGETE